MKYKNLIWDWNGTLLDDLQACLVSVNKLLTSREIQPLTRERYHNIFTFPVRDYYQLAGFNFEKDPFDVLAQEFMDHYNETLKGCQLHTEVTETLSSMQEAGYNQIILSAMEHNQLTGLIRYHGIEQYFNGIFGIHNHHADGKLHVAEKAMMTSGFRADETCMIGDTLHDAEVAEKLGISCVLVTLGHQSAERLRQSGHPVVNRLKEISRFV